MSITNHIAYFRLASENFGLINKVFRRDLIVPEFKQFTDELTLIYNKCKSNKEGKARVDQSMLCSLLISDILTKIECFVHPPTDEVKP